MADAFLGEIRVFAGNFAPKGWAFCNGQLLPISQNTALFSLLGTLYGGDGRSNFALPNLQAAFPMHQGQGPGLSPRTAGETGGQATVTLLETQMPTHTHGLKASVSPITGSASASVARAPASGAVYRIPGSTKAMAAETLAATGAGAPHENRQPYLALSFIIAMQGIYPPRS